MKWCRESLLMSFVVFLSAALLCGCAVQRPRQSAVPSTVQAESVNWNDLAQWKTETDGHSQMETRHTPGVAFEVRYALNGEPVRWVKMDREVAAVPADARVVIRMKATGPADLEIKFIDADGSVFGRKVPLAALASWTNLVVCLESLEYWWGGDDRFAGLASLSLAFSGEGTGTVWIGGVSLGSASATPSFDPGGPVLDPDRDLPGIGFRQRRADRMIPEEPGVLEWLKQVQDRSSQGRQLLPSMEDNSVLTFNQALVAMAFILKGDRERAERILDFFAAATVPENPHEDLQNFYVNSQPRGFHQFFHLNREGDVPALHRQGDAGRWMGDMAWLLIAYKYYEKTYASDRYRKTEDLLRDFLISLYTDADDGLGGYVQHSWLHADRKLHRKEPGHPEGNIDCYAAFRLCGEEALAEKIRTWVDHELRGRKSLPLDLYTWRVLAFGPECAELLNIPEHDLRYRKTVDAGGNPAVGFWNGAAPGVSNLWLDGTGHIACAFHAAGQRERASFYANQYEPFFIDRDFDGVKAKALPYTANRSEGCEWVRYDRGYVSVAAWYLFAKNGFNPLTLDCTEVR